MSVTEVKQALGRWNITLHAETPVELINRLTYFGHIALLPGKVDPAQYDDNLLSAARYVGVYRSRDAEDYFRLSGSGMAFWLGDEDNKGDIFETAVILDGETFPDTVRALLPPGGSIVEGTLYSVAGTYTGRHQWQTPREALTYVTDLYNAEWRVNSDGTLDAGLVSDLYVTSPKALLVPKGFGSDLLRRVIAGDSSMETNVEDITTRVVLLAEGEGTGIATGSADAPATGYKDIHGNPLKATRLVSESGTEADNAEARAQLQLNRFVNPKRSVDLSTEEYDIKGTFVVGDYLHVYDPVNDFYDPNNEIYWEGERINPMALRCVEMTWPIPAGWTVAFRDINGNWFDLSEYYVSESGETTLIVGDLPRGLASIGGEPIGVRPNLPDADTPGPDTTIPAAPGFTAFSTGSYESDDRTLSAIYTQWDQPLNQDGSIITDGSHYEIRYRANAIIGTYTQWDYLSGGYDVDFTADFTTPETDGWGSDWDVYSSSASETEFLVDGDEGRIVHPTFNFIRAIEQVGSWLDTEIVAYRRINYMPAGASTVMGVYSRRTSDSWYWGRVEPNADATVTVKLTKYVSGAMTEFGVTTLPGVTHYAGAVYGVKMTTSGNVLTLKVWQGGPDAEPVQDTLSAIDTAPLAGAGFSGIADWIVNGATNPANSITRTESFEIRSLTPDTTGWSWDDLNTWDALTSTGVVTSSNWTIAYIPWDQTTFTIVELAPGVQYELQIRAVDTASPPNVSPWSTSSFVNTTGDAIAPSTPAVPEVAASMIAVQLTHRLGKASGGTYNLEQDLHHFDVHASHSSTFFADNTNKVGELLASGAMIRSSIPAVGSFKVDQAASVWIKVVAVDRTGNKSSSSEAVQSSVELIDNAHISSLSVSKLTAGTITANSVLAAEFEVASGGNIEITGGFLRVRNNLGEEEARAGLMSDGSYGFAAIDPDTGEFGKLSQLIFGPDADTVSALQNASSTSYSDLSTVGPTVSFTVGSTGKILIGWGADININSDPDDTQGGYMSWVFSGPTSISAGTHEAYCVLGVIDASADTAVIGALQSISKSVLIQGLTPGSYTATAKYKRHTASAQPVYFLNRTIWVLPY